MKVESVSFYSAKKHCEHFCNPNEYNNVQHCFIYLPEKPTEKHYGKKFIATMLAFAAIAVGITLKNISTTKKIKSNF